MKGVPFDYIENFPKKGRTLPKILVFLKVVVVFRTFLFFGKSPCEYKTYGGWPSMLD